jgi:hypothetical protein
MGGIRYVRQSDLSFELLFQYFFKSGGGKIVQTFEVAVQNLGGDIFRVKLDKSVNSTVAALKRAIETQEGTSRHKQVLYNLNETDHHQEKRRTGNTCSEEVSLELEDESGIGGPCTVILCVNTEEKLLKWDISSPLVVDSSIRIGSSDNTIATKQGFHMFDMDNCLLVAGAAMGLGEYSISFKVIRGGIVTVGVVKDGFPTDKSPFRPDSNAGWGMTLANGSLWGNGKRNDDRAGGLREGQVLTLQLDTDKGLLFC